MKVYQNFKSLKGYLIILIYSISIQVLEIVKINIYEKTKMLSVDNLNINLIYWHNCLDILKKLFLSYIKAVILKLQNIIDIRKYNRYKKKTNLKQII